MSHSHRKLHDHNLLWPQRVEGFPVQGFVLLLAFEALAVSVPKMIGIRPFIILPVILGTLGRAQGLNAHRADGGLPRTCTGVFFLQYFFRW